MDESLLYVGLLVALMGLIGVILPLTGASEQFKDLQGLGGFITAFGVLLIPVAIFKDGLPILSSKGKAVVGIVLLIIITEALVYLFIS